MIDVIVSAENDQNNGQRRALIDANSARQTPFSPNTSGVDIQDEKSGNVHRTTFMQQFGQLSQRALISTVGIIITIMYLL